MSLSADLRHARKAMADAPTQGVLACTAILARFPANVPARGLLAAMAPAQRQAVRADAERLCDAAAPAEALALLAPLCAAHPRDPDLTQAAGRCLFALGRFAEMAALCRGALADHPDHPGLLASWGTALYRMGQAEAALPPLRRAAALAPRDPHVANHLGLVLRSLGDLAAAEAAFRVAVAPPSGLPEGWLNLAQLADFTADAALLPALDACLSAPGHPAGQVELLCFARAKAALDRGDPDAAPWLVRANALHRAAHPHDEAGDAARVVDLARRLPPAAWAAARPGPRAVLVVGMPRSGTTLVERILARHHQVTGLGECADLHRLVAQIDTGAPWTADHREALASAYTGALAARADTPVAVDKMPSNALLGGFALAALPNARLVHVRRDPVATALSNYRIRYTEGNEFAYDLADIAARHRLTDAMMAQWAAAYPDRVHVVALEALIEAPERQIAALLHALDLPPDPACLHFDGARGDVRTASAHQVRGPVARQSGPDPHALAARLPLLTRGLDTCIAGHAAALAAARG